MTNRPEHSELHDEAQLEKLLKSGYAAPPPAAEFQETLLRQLGQEFDRTYLAAPSQTRSENASLRSRRRISLRMALTMATAASLLFVVALWNSQTAYGWASMIHALANCGWVQAVSTTNPEAGPKAGERLSGWVSAQRGIVAIRSGDEIAFRDHREHISTEYLSNRRVIYQQALPASLDSLGPEELFGLLLGKKIDTGLRVLSESWRRVESREDHEAAIELRVTLGIQSRSYELLIMLNPETHLPKSCQLLSSKQESPQSFEFVYPTEGPSSIFSLGIPRETKVIASLSKLTSEEHGTPQESTTLATTLATTLPDETPEIIEADTKSSTTEEPAQQTTQRVASNPSRPTRVLPAPALPDEPLAPKVLVEQINAQLAASWQFQGISAAERASDSEFLRRTYLDLTGRIPMVSEVYQFLEDQSPNRRELLVDELLTSRDHATHLAIVWRKLLLPEGVNATIYGGTEKFDQWLADRFEKNLPYDELVRQLLLAEGRVSDSGPILFYAALKLNPEELAGKTARAFLGMRMECAQCHDHPFDESISQTDFWGFAAHFAQISRPQGKMEMTSSVLRVRDSRRGEVVHPDSDKVIPPRMPYLLNPVDQKSDTQTKSPPKERTPKKVTSRREALVDWLVTKQNSRFARATVNRVWQHLFGLGLVEPVDDMRADNPAACPEVFETLSLDFAASGYDLRRLLRTLVLSDAYQLSSRAATDEPSQSLVFARMNIKSFTADQLYDCISVATQYEAMRAGNAENGALARFGNSSRQAFVEQFRAPPGQRTDYHAGIPQALTLMHGRLVHGATDLASSGLLKSLSAPFFTDQQRIETLFLATLSRYPDAIEREKMLAHVEAASDDEGRSRALGDILWALLNSAEFTFIH
ncbi:MAG: DUF1549 domain-containing protein [Planctomycetes bacterium]|nr:DUF1549 domain-containing protein [Planctomycetota bacterium]